MGLSTCLGNVASCQPQGNCSTNGTTNSSTAQTPYCAALHPGTCHMSYMCPGIIPGCIIPGCIIILGCCMPGCGNPPGCCICMGAFPIAKLPKPGAMPAIMAGIM